MACIDGSSLTKITAYAARLKKPRLKKTRDSLNKQQPTPRLFDVIVPRSFDEFPVF